MLKVTQQVSVKLGLESLWFNSRADVLNENLNHLYIKPCTKGINYTHEWVRETMASWF